jgi:hypothetical protein
MNPAERHEDGDDPRKSATHDESVKVHSYECLDALEPVLGGKLSIRCPQVPYAKGRRSQQRPDYALGGRHPTLRRGQCPTPTQAPSWSM